MTATLFFIVIIRKMNIKLLGMINSFVLYDFIVSKITQILDVHAYEKDG